MTDTRDVGDGYPIRYQTRDVDTRELVDATVVLTLVNPSGGSSTPTVVHSSTGTYDYTIPLTEAGAYVWTWDASGTVVDRTYGSVYAGDPAPPTYASLDDVKDFLKITDTRDDAELLKRLPAATRRVERDTGRRFWLSSTVSTRTYRARHPELLPVDDIATTVGLLVDTGRGTAWTALDLDTVDYLPENALENGSAIEMLQLTYGVWPVFGSTRVRVTARWGWLAVPEDIVMATCIQAARLFSRKDSINGIVGNSDYGPVRVSRYDADYDNLIHPYVKVKP